MIKIAPVVHTGMVLRVIGRIGLVGFFDGLNKALSVMEVNPPCSNEALHEWDAVKASVHRFAHFLIRENRRPPFTSLGRPVR